MRQDPERKDGKRNMTHLDLPVLIVRRLGASHADI